ncbi:MAG: helix-turn-helix domain-containing protein [Eubacteriales bacterium]
MNITEKLSLGKTLKVQRVLKDMSVQEVITKAGISASTYDNIESGRTKPIPVNIKENRKCT